MHTVRYAEGGTNDLILHLASVDTVLTPHEIQILSINRNIKNIHLLECPSTKNHEIRDLCAADNKQNRRQ